MNTDLNDKGSAAIVGVGTGLGAALGRYFASMGHRCLLGARNIDRVKEIADQIDGAVGTSVDATDENAVKTYFDIAEADLGPVEVCVFNASGRIRDSILDLDTDEFISCWKHSCLGGFVVGREAARRMVPRGRGTIIFTGATASVKGFARSAGFAAGKFGLRGIAESMARELHPLGVHVVHVVIDGGIGFDDSDALLDPNEIARAYYELSCQGRSVWSNEVELRPWTENF